MEFEIQYYPSSVGSSRISEESLDDLQLMLGDLIVYSPPQPALLPANPCDQFELENDYFELEERRPRTGSGTYLTKRKNKQIKKLIRRRGSTVGK